jgi:hypothetical protein
MRQTVNGLGFIRNSSSFTNQRQIIEEIKDNAHPLQIIIQSEPSRKWDSMKAEMMNSALQMMGTYKILLGFCLHI